ncbi:MAG: maleylpyruvate isomerase N-terminal domain-containing protein [Mycobacterium sp.]
MGGRGQRRLTLSALHSDLNPLRHNPLRIFERRHTVTLKGLAAARECSAKLAGIVPMVDERQWESPSACAGWRVIDVLAHLGALAYEAVHPPEPDPTWPHNRERYHDLRVDQRRGWSHAQVIDEWRRYAPQQLDLLKSGQEPPQSTQPITVTGLGIYPRHLLANTTAFNVLCHLWFDMLAPHGPLPFSLPAPTDDQVGPAVEFMLAGLPQMQGPELDATVAEPLVLDLTAPGATVVTVLPAARPDQRLSVVSGSLGATTIRSSALDFIAWGTTRKPWRDYCTITGDASVATQFLDCLNII